MRLLTDIIEEAYALFAPYTLGNTLDVCKVCCVTEAEEQALLAAPLREASAELLNCGYLSSAHSSSDQERWEMKHFLPRVLELVSQFDFPRFTPEVVFSRLDLNQPAYWPIAERELLADFALAYFKQCLAHYPLPDGLELPEILLMFGQPYFDLAPLLQAWVAADTPSSIAHFTDLLLNGSRIVSNGIIKFGSAFSEPRHNQQLTTWLTNPLVQAAWKSQLEQVILRDQLHPNQAERASWAYEVLTHGLPKLPV